MSKKNKASKLIKTNIGGVTQIKTIFWWEHAEGGKAHCLARIFLWDDNTRVIIVISELKSNKKKLNCSFIELSEALLEQFNYLIKVPKESIEWFTHYGAFSNHEGLGSETLGKVDPLQIIYFKSMKLRMPKTIFKLKENFKDNLGGIELGKMRPVLKELDWELIDWSSDAEWE